MSLHVRSGSQALAREYVASWEGKSISVMCHHFCISLELPERKLGAVMEWAGPGKQGAK